VKHEFLLFAECGAFVHDQPHGLDPAWVASSCQPTVSRCRDFVTRTESALTPTLDERGAHECNGHARTPAGNNVGLLDEIPDSGL
jgi:hypothetical protein